MGGKGERRRGVGEAGREEGEEGRGRETDSTAVMDGGKQSAHHPPLSVSTTQVA